jgi:hypothetical protein
MAIVPFVWMIYWPIYNTFKSFYSSKGFGLLPTSVLASASTSFHMLMIINPLIVVRVRLQTQHLRNTTKYRNIF